ncbi:MAG: hypothetical protein RJA61_711 [Candidatus Parcubacteria bacterium]|jgi:hypothetical protein
MESFLQSDIFFFVSLGSIIIIAVLVIIVASYVIGILRDVKSVTKQVKGGTKKAGEEALPVFRSVLKVLSTVFLVSLFKKVSSKKNQEEKR